VRFHLRTPVQQISKSPKGFLIQAGDLTLQASQVVSAIPINNLIDLLGEKPKGIRDVRTESQLWSAFQTSFSVNQKLPFSALHHQIHLENPIPKLPGKTLFVSFGMGSVFHIPTTGSDRPMETWWFPSAPT